MADNTKSRPAEDWPEFPDIPEQAFQEISRTHQSLHARAAHLEASGTDRTDKGGRHDDPRTDGSDGGTGLMRCFRGRPTVYTRGSFSGPALIFCELVMMQCTDAKLKIKMKNKDKTRGGCMLSALLFTYRRAVWRRLPMKGGASGRRACCCPRNAGFCPMLPYRVL